MLHWSRRAFVAATVCALGVAVASCGDAPADPVGSAQAETTIDVSSCVPSTLPGGTWIDENGQPRSPQTGPIIGNPPESIVPPDPIAAPDTDGPPIVGDVPADILERARSIALNDGLVGDLLRSENATFVLAEPWKGQDGESIGVTLEYRFEKPVELPMGHGVIVAAGPEMGEQAKYEASGLPTKSEVGASEVWGGVELADVFVSSSKESVYAVQPMTDTARHPC